MTSSKGASINDVHIPQANPSNDLKVLYILLSIHSQLGAGAGGIHKTDSSIRGRPLRSVRQLLRSVRQPVLLPYVLGKKNFLAESKVGLHLRSFPGTHFV